MSIEEVVPRYKLLKDHVLIANIEVAMIEGGFVDRGDPDHGIVFAHVDVNVVAADEETPGEDEAFRERGAGVEVFADDRIERHSGDFEWGMGFESAPMM